MKNSTANHQNLSITSRTVLGAAGFAMLTALYLPIPYVIVWRY